MAGGLDAMVVSFTIYTERKNKPPSKRYISLKKGEKLWVEQLLIVTLVAVISEC